MTNQELLTMLAKKQKDCPHDGTFVPAGQQSVVNDVANKWIIMTTEACSKCGALVFLRNETPINPETVSKRVAKNTGKDGKILN